MRRTDRPAPDCMNAKLISSWSQRAVDIAGDRAGDAGRSKSTRSPRLPIVAARSAHRRARGRAPGRGPAPGPFLYARIDTAAKTGGRQHVRPRTHVDAVEGTIAVWSNHGSSERHRRLFPLPATSRTKHESSPRIDRAASSSDATAPLAVGPFEDIRADDRFDCAPGRRSPVTGARQHSANSTDAPHRARRCAAMRVRPSISSRQRDIRDAVTTLRRAASNGGEWRRYDRESSRPADARHRRSRREQRHRDLGMSDRAGASPCSVGLQVALGQEAIGRAFLSVSRKSLEARLGDGIADSNPHASGKYGQQAPTPKRCSDGTACPRRPDDEAVLVLRRNELGLRPGAATSTRRRRPASGEVRAAM